MKYLLMISLITLIGCPTEGKYVPPDNLCESAEANLRVLGCKDSRGVPMSGPNKSGQMFNEICINARIRQVDLNPACITTAKSCDAANKCPR